jgi:hypothetical protein
MITPQQCWIVCNNKLFRTAKWLLSALSIGLTSAFVVMLEIS